VSCAARARAARGASGVDAVGGGQVHTPGGEAAGLEQFRAGLRRALGPIAEVQAVEFDRAGVFEHAVETAPVGHAARAGRAAEVGAERIRAVEEPVERFAFGLGQLETEAVVETAG